MPLLLKLIFPFSTNEFLNETFFAKGQGLRSDHQNKCWELLVEFVFV